MTDFNFSEEQEMLRETVRDILARTYSPEHHGKIARTDLGFDKALWRQFADIGLLGLTFSEEDGGMGAGPVEVAAVCGELGRANAFEPLLQCALGPGALVGKAGTPEQRKEILSEVAAGDRLLALAHAEPGARWAAPHVSASAAHTASTWTVTGVKTPVPYGAAADTLVVSANLPGGGVGLFLVDAKAQGVAIAPFATVDGHRAAQVSFVDAEAALLGETKEDRFQLVCDELVALQIALCAEAVGAMDEALRITTEYLKTRKQFGVPLRTFQALTQRAADLYVLVELARSMSLWGTAALDDGSATQDTASRVKLQIGRSGRKVALEAIQMHGGIGLTDEYPISHYAARLIAIAHTLGSTDDHLRVLTTKLEPSGTVAVV
jgi:alkylation response protein AidB-like acyl-CoA dehydrogenase